MLCRLSAPFKGAYFYLCRKRSIANVRNKCCYLEYLIVEHDHDDARYVERGERRVYDEVVIVEHAHGWIAYWRVVEAEHDGRANGGGNQPHEPNGEPDALVVFVPGVFYRLRHCNVPVERTRSGAITVSLGKRRCTAGFFRNVALLSRAHFRVAVVAG